MAEYGEDEAEKAELEMYGLTNKYEESDYGDSDEERSAIEQAMFMRIHYAAEVENKVSDDANITNEDDVAMISKEENNTIFKSLLEDNGDISVRMIPRTDQGTVTNELNLKNKTMHKALADVIEKESEVTIISLDKENQETKDEPSLDDSVVSVENSMSDDMSNSKYSLANSKNDSGTKDTGNLPKNVRVSTIDVDSTVCISSASSSDSDSDIFIVSSKSPCKKQKKNKKSSASSVQKVGLKINRKASLTNKGVEVARHRPWRGKDVPAKKPDGNQEIFEITSETISKSLKESQNSSLKGRKRKDVSGGGRGGGDTDSERDDSDSDCMLIESMSEDEDMAFNFVTPLGMSRQDDKPRDEQKEKNDSSTLNSDVIGLGSKGPLCLNCNEFGHPARYCPLSKKDTRQATPQQQQIKRPSRYFQEELTDTPSPAKKRISVCVLCGEKGHFDKVCPDAICFNCNLPGHRASECDSFTPAKLKYCSRCQMNGHSKQMCPDLWRQYHLTMEQGRLIRPTAAVIKNLWNSSSLYCCNCGTLGHHAYECNEKRMNHYTIVPCPYVCVYDQTRGEKKQQKREAVAKLYEAEFEENKAHHRAAQTLRGSFQKVSSPVEEVPLRRSKRLKLEPVPKKRRIKLSIEEKIIQGVKLTKKERRQMKDDERLYKLFVEERKRTNNLFRLQQFDPKMMKQFDAKMMKQFNKKMEKKEKNKAKRKRKRQQRQEKKQQQVNEKKTKKAKRKNSQQGIPMKKQGDRTVKFVSEKGFRFNFQGSWFEKGI